MVVILLLMGGDACLLLCTELAATTVSPKLPTAQFLRYPRNTSTRVLRHFIGAINADTDIKVGSFCVYVLTGLTPIMAANSEASLTLFIFIGPVTLCCNRRQPFLAEVGTS